MLWLFLEVLAIAELIGFSDEVTSIFVLLLSDTGLFETLLGQFSLAFRKMFLHYTKTREVIKAHHRPNLSRILQQIICLFQLALYFDGILMMSLIALDVLAF